MTELLSDLSLPAGGAAWLDAARAAALASFRAQGLPTLKTEGWRFTPIDAVSKTDFEAARRPRIRGGFGSRALCPITFHRVVVQNGRVLPGGEGSSYSGLPAGVRVQSLAEALRDDPDSLKTAFSRGFDQDGLPFASLAAALFQDGLVIKVARHVRLDKPLGVLFDSGDNASGRPQMAHVRLLIMLEEGASAEIVEESVGSGSARFWTNLLTQVALGEGASLKHYRLQRENEHGVQTSASFIEAGPRARYESHAFSFGGELVRSDLRVRLAGAGAECALNGLALVRDREVVDHHSRVEHASLGGTTRQLYKAVLDEKARYVFDGLVDVRPGAQKTDAWVYNKNLLVSEDADVHSNPEFRIRADDVSCKHGGTIGQMSLESLFYLQSRGVGAADARRMLVYAFGSEMIERVGLEPLRVALAAALHARMPEAIEEAA
ncbi:MAG: Fe-S cluster assembly protein SufD [Elusimicrobia bacterium RBG_16_66_12]|nr:MAG: Fe-S cluster assembly protein SufD [Elusimicrobia bacterium RBG_16_66_12]